MAIEFEQHFDRRACTIQPDERSSRDLLAALESASVKSDAIHLLEGALRGMIARWADNAS